MDRALRISVGRERAGVSLRILTLATVLALFALITLGGVVRVTESGLGCPDWPLCHGRILPSTDAATLIEYSHRLLASVTGFMVLATAVVVWKARRGERWLVVPVTIGLLLLVFQVVLGGVTVQTDLNSGLVMAHLGVGEALLAVMIVATVVAWGGSSMTKKIRDVRAEGERRPVLLLIALGATFALLLTGSYVQASGATGACGDSWPLCQGELLPEGKLPMVHMLHRILSLVVGVVLVASLAMVWFSRGQQARLKMVALVVGGLLLSQIAIGGLNVLLAFPQSTNVLHLSVATALWASLVFLAALAYPVPSAVTGGSDAD